MASSPHVLDADRYGAWIVAADGSDSEIPTGDFSAVLQLIWKTELQDNNRTGAPATDFSAVQTVLFMPTALNNRTGAPATDFNLARTRSALKSDAGAPVLLSSLAAD